MPHDRACETLRRQLYDLAAEEALTDRLLQELQTAVDSIKAEPQYLRLLATTSVPKQERCDLLAKAFEGAPPRIWSTSSSSCARRTHR